MAKRKTIVSLQRFRNKAQRLSHGVMVALQFLVLPDQVRVLVRQQKSKITPDYQIDSRAFLFKHESQTEVYPNEVPFYMLNPG